MDFKLLTQQSICCCGPKFRLRTKSHVCSGACQSIAIRDGKAESNFISCVKSGVQVSVLVRDKVFSHHHRFVVVASVQHVWQPLLPNPDSLCLSSGPTPVSMNCAHDLCEFFSQHAWAVGSPRSIHRVSWVELVCTFIFQYGFHTGFLNKSMTLKVLVQRFTRVATRLLKSHGCAIHSLRSTHLSSFGFRLVDSVHLSHSFKFPDQLIAFPMGCAGLFAKKKNPNNFVPNLLD